VDNGSCDIEFNTLSLPTILHRHVQFSPNCVLLTACSMKTPDLYGKEQSVHEQVDAETRFVLRSRCVLGEDIQSDNVRLANCSCVLFNKMVIYAPLIIQSQSVPGRPV